VYCRGCSGCWDAVLLLLLSAEEQQYHDIRRAGSSGEGSCWMSRPQEVSSGVGREYQQMAWGGWSASQLVGDRSRQGRTDATSTTVQALTQTAKNHAHNLGVSMHAHTHRYIHRLACMHTRKHNSTL
jgi:hypothetical protein